MALKITIGDVSVATSADGADAEVISTELEMTFEGGTTIFRYWDGERHRQLAIVHSELQKGLTALVGE